MTVYVFVGPTLDPAMARRELDAVYLPPVAQGDVYRVARTRPRAIGIVDGYFERVPSVWHKEILWAMQEGIHVFGSASMGALRAAELTAFGMEGVGWIYQAFADGTLTDDDEVAVAHGAAEDGYRSISEAMVNIRRTLAGARAAGILGPETHDLLLHIAKGLFYPDRSYPRMLRDAAEAGAPAAELAALRAWLPSGRVDQKRADALAMLRLMRERTTAELPRKQVRYAFAHTDGWEMVRQQAGDPAATAGAETEAGDGELLLDELRLAPAANAAARTEGLLRLLADYYARQEGYAVPAAARLQAMEEFRRERGLLQPEQIDAWLAQHQLSRDDFVRLLEDEAQMRWVQEQLAYAVAGRVADRIRLADSYPDMQARAREKQRRWQAQGLQNARLAELALSEEALLEWYFNERLGRPLPADSAQYAQDAGFADRDALLRALLREYRCTA